jgi:hypothetical protein
MKKQSADFVYAPIMQKIAARAVASFVYADRLSCVMDLSAVNAREPLDLQKLSGFDDFNFYHDVDGIKRNLNRLTGNLEHCFLPRCIKGVADV